MDDKGFLQSTSLEEIFVTLGPGLLSILLRQVRSRLAEAAVLIDGRQLLNGMVVETVQHDQQHTACRGERLKTGLGEGVRLQFTILVGSDQVLLLLDVTIQNGKIQIGRGLVDIGITVISLENIWREVSSLLRECALDRKLNPPWITNEAQSKNKLETLLG